jgi:hypothetical protein
MVFAICCALGYSYATGRLESLSVPQRIRHQSASRIKIFNQLIVFNKHRSPSAAPPEQQQQHQQQPCHPRKLMRESRRGLLGLAGLETT